MGQMNFDQVDSRKLFDTNLRKMQRNLYKKINFASYLILIILLMCVDFRMAYAELSAIPALTITNSDDGTQNYSLTLQILILMTLMSFLPAVVITMTSFTRIIIVFAILRQAIGLHQTPSNQILVGLALFLSIFIMSPVLEEVNSHALQPYLSEDISQTEAIQKLLLPFKKFMLAQTRSDELNLFSEISQQEVLLNEGNIPFSVLIPSFIVSELKTAFQIGFLVFIPFLIIDLVVASVLMAMGMMMLSPLIISLPFKIMLFVFIDGWSMIIGTLASSFSL